MLNNLKIQIVAAIKNKDHIRRDILRVIVGELETLESRKPNSVTQDRIYSTIRKQIEANNEALSYQFNERLVEENRILEEYLPKNLSRDEIKKHLLTLTLPDNIGQATGVAIRYFKQNKLDVLGGDVSSVIGEL